MRAAIEELQAAYFRTKLRSTHVETRLKGSYGHMKRDADARVKQTCAVRALARCSAAVHGVVAGACGNRASAGRSAWCRVIPAPPDTKSADTPAAHFLGISAGACAETVRIPRRGSCSAFPSHGIPAYSRTRIISLQLSSSMQDGASAGSQTWTAYSQLATQATGGPRVHSRAALRAAQPKSKAARAVLPVPTEQLDRRGCGVIGLGRTPRPEAHDGCIVQRSLHDRFGKGAVSVVRCTFRMVA